jgi:RNase P subunit RPR2
MAPVPGVVVTMTGDEPDPDVPVHCPECGTTTRVPLSGVAEAIERHNEGLHDGEEVARVDPELADRLADIVAEELGLL